MQKKALSALLAAGLLLGLLSGCGDNTTSQSSAAESPSSAASVSAAESSSTAAGEAEAGSVNRFGWEVPAEPIKFTLFNASGNYAPTEGEAGGLRNSLDYLREHFNVDLTVETTSGDGKEALNLALAAGNYPEVITNINRDYTKRFVEQGKVVELTPYMDTLAADVKALMGEMYPLFLDDAGKLWRFPVDMGALYELPDYSAHIRYDEWTAIGSPEIKTPDDYYNALNAILEQFPTNPNGESRYAMSLYDLGDMPLHYSGYWGLQKGFKISDSGDFTYWAFTDEGKNMSKFFNRFHLDGTLDPDAFVNKFDDWKAKFSNERIVGAVGGWWISYNAGHEVWNEIDPNTPEEKRFIQVSFKAPEAEAAYITPKSEIPDNNTILTDKAQDIEGIVKFVNFQATERGRALVGWGIPNGVAVGDTGREVKAWEIDEQGNWAIDPTAKQQLIDESWSYQDAAWAESMPKLFYNVSRWDDGVHCGWLNQMWYSENKWKTIMMDNMKGTIFNATPLTLLDKSDEVMTMETAITDAWKMGWPAVVTANSDAELDAAWAALQASLETAGIHAYEQVMADNYRANMEKLGTAGTIN